jgi:phosphoribosylformylglycinamidine synthase
VIQYQAKIRVTLRPSVLDPAGTAVASGLQNMGYNTVEQVRMGKYIELTLQAENQTQAEEMVNSMCDRLLANPVIENYEFDVEAVAAGANT